MISLLLLGRLLEIQRLEGWMIDWFERNFVLGIKVLFSGQEIVKHLLAQLTISPNNTTFSPRMRNIPT